MAAARQTVARWGYANASLSRIAEQAGTSKSVISYHFSGKDELLTLVVKQFFEQTGQYMEARIEGATTSADKVQAWVGSQLEYFAQHRTAFLAMSEIVISHRAVDGSRPLLDAEEEEVDALADILAAGQRAGEFREFDPRSVAAIVIRCTEGVLGSWAMNDTVDLDAQTTVLLDFINYAIRRDQG